MGAIFSSGFVLQSFEFIEPVHFGARHVLSPATLLGVWGGVRFTLARLLSFQLVMSHVAKQLQPPLSLNKA